MPPPCVGKPSDLSPGRQTLLRSRLRYSLRRFLHLALVGVQLHSSRPCFVELCPVDRLPAIPPSLELRSEVQGKPTCLPLRRHLTRLQIRTDNPPPTSASANRHPTPFGSILVGGSQSSLNLWLRRRVARSLRNRPLFVRRRLRSPALEVVLILLLGYVLLPSLFTRSR